MGNDVQSPRWNKTVAKNYIGKYIIIRITYFDDDGNETLKQQLHGIIESANKTNGIIVALKGQYEGLTWIMPPDPSIKPANPGIYNLTTTGETVENPDLLSSWAILEPSADQIDVNSETITAIKRRIMFVESN